MPVRPRRMSLVPSCVGPLPAGSRRRVFLGKRPRLVSASPGPPTLSWGLGAETAESPRLPPGTVIFCWHCIAPNSAKNQTPFRGNPPRVRTRRMSLVPSCVGPPSDLLKGI
jgi:hypothetical protein